MARKKKKSTRGGTKRRRSRRRSSGKRSSNKQRPLSQRLLPSFSLSVGQKALLGGIALVFFTVVLLLSLLSPNQGQLTSWLAALLWQGFGWGGLAVPFFLGAIGFYLVLWGMEQAPQLPRWRLVGLLMLFLTFEAFASLMGVVLDNGMHDVWSVARAQTGGGYVGGVFAWVLAQTIGRPLAILLLTAVGLVASVLLFEISRDDVQVAGRWIWERRPQRQSVAVDDRQIPINRPVRQAAPTTPTVPQPAAALDGETPATPPTPSEQRKPSTARANGSTEEKAESQADKTADGYVEPAPFVVADNGSGDIMWELPELDEMLEPGGEQELSNAAIREQVEIIEHTLDSFGAPAKVVEINQGPTVTQYGVEPQFLERRSGKRVKVKVGKIASLADDIALALAAHSVRVEAPVPGKGYVGLEVPNTHKALVNLRDVMETAAFQRIRSPLRIALGQNVSGHAVAADLAKMPHLLIAGATGSGKSVCVNGVIASLLLQNTPEQLRMVMVDPKRVELTGYNGIPHLVAPVVVDMERVIATLQWALREMDMRYQKLAEIGARNIADYNRKIAGTGKKHMPYIVIFIDELADLMMVSPEDTERSVTRLAQMARATGIHMVIATQRPSVDVVTGLIKANFPARIAFAVASGTDSRVILDSTGAERLLGQGDMLFQSPDAGTPLRLQGAFVSDKELTSIINYWRAARRRHRVTVAEAREKAEEAEASTLPPPTQQPLWEDLIEEEEEKEYEDELVPEAIALVRDLGKASTSLLQRRFRIGYTRASRIMDVMEEEGIIGPPTGTSKAREVLSYGSSDGGNSGGSSDAESGEQEVDEATEA
ncbi:MAG: DNA translocase FtsK 4TM domain-containing protein [Candidatus Promineifilaceae bacterium]|nr:DNA translocase FtsK 4TM domain-containing protein [Candidatus Promineifilaceae bacterium]